MSRPWGWGGAIWCNHEYLGGAGDVVISRNNFSYCKSDRGGDAVAYTSEPNIDSTISFCTICKCFGYCCLDNARKGLTVQYVVFFDNQNQNWGSQSWKKTETGDGGSKDYATGIICTVSRCTVEDCIFKTNWGYPFLLASGSLYYQLYRVLLDGPVGTANAVTTMENVKENQAIRRTLCLPVTRNCTALIWCPTGFFTASLKFLSSGRGFSSTQRYSSTKSMSASKSLSKTLAINGTMAFTVTETLESSCYFSRSGSFSDSVGNSKSYVFSPTEELSKSMFFTDSNSFSVTADLSLSHGDKFGDSKMFSESEKRSLSKSFSSSGSLTFSYGFSATIHFSLTEYFTASKGIEPSATFSSSNVFSNSLGFSGVEEHESPTSIEVDDSETAPSADSPESTITKPHSGFVMYPSTGLPVATGLLQTAVPHASTISLAGAPTPWPTGVVPSTQCPKSTEPPVATVTVAPIEFGTDSITKNSVKSVTSFSVTSFSVTSISVMTSVSHFTKESEEVVQSANLGSANMEQEESLFDLSFIVVCVILIVILSTLFAIMLYKESKRKELLERMEEKENAEKEEKETQKFNAELK
jgi:hypothetical protein